MPGIFSSCIVSKRPGLSYSGSLGKSDMRRTRRFGSCIRSSKYSSETTRTESSYGSIEDVDRALASILLDERLSSQVNDVSSDDIRTISLTARSADAPCISEAFYSNKEHNAMIFSNKSDNTRTSNTYGKVRTQQRQYEPSPSPCPCEWGYFVDTE